MKFLKPIVFPLLSLFALLSVSLFAMVWFVGSSGIHSPTSMLAAVGSSASTCVGPSGQDPTKFTPSFTEEFNGTSLDTNKWSDKFWWENANPDINYAVEGGALKIWPSANFVNRVITTQQKYTQTYGYFEIQAKLPYGKGPWPAFWLYHDHGGVDDPSLHRSLDVMESYPGGGVNSGWGDANLHATAFEVAVHPTDTTTTAYKKQSTEFDLSNSFHTYAMKWEPNKVTYYFDSYEIYSANVSISDPMFLNLDIFFDGTKPSGAPDATTPTGKTNSFEVNYVRAWNFGGSGCPVPAPVNAYDWIPAASYYAQYGTQHGGSPDDVGWLTGGDWLRYNNIQFGSGGANAFDLNLAVDPSIVGNKIEVRLDSLTGTKIGEITTKSTDGWSVFRESTVNITPTTGTHDVYLVMVGADGMGSIRSFKFIPVSVQSRDAYSLIQGESADAGQGVDLTGGAVHSLDNNDWVEYKNLNFGTGGNLSFAAWLSVPADSAGQKVEVRLDTPSGALLGTLTVASTGGWESYAQQSIPITSVSGARDVYLVAKGSYGVGNIDAFKFISTAPAQTPTTPVPSPASPPPTQPTPAPSPTPTPPSSVSVTPPPSSATPSSSPATTTSTTGSTSPSLSTDSSPTLSPISFSVEALSGVGSVHCDKGYPETQVRFTATPASAGEFGVQLPDGTNQEYPSGIQLLRNGTYHWRGDVRAGFSAYVRVAPYQGEFTLNAPACTSELGGGTAVPSPVPPPAPLGSNFQPSPSVPVSSDPLSSCSTPESCQKACVDASCKTFVREVAPPALPSAAPTGSVASVQPIDARIGARVFIDTDGDGISDYDEVNIYHTDPKKKDTDGDGVSDGDELLARTDPLMFNSANGTMGTSTITTPTTTLALLNDPRSSGISLPSVFKVENIVSTPHPGATSSLSTSTLRLHLSGRAIPNAFITLYIFSEPIVVVVKADDTGAWTYTLDKELPDGAHQVYSAITDASGKIIAKSEPLPFVKEAQAITIGVSGAPVAPEEVAPSFFSGMPVYASVLMLIILLGFAIALIGLMVRSRGEDPPFGSA